MNPNLRNLLVFLATIVVGIFAIKIVLGFVVGILSMLVPIAIVAGVVYCGYLVFGRKALGPGRRYLP